MADMRRKRTTCRKTRGFFKIRRLGYARITTYGQALGAQLKQLCVSGCTQIYRERVMAAQRDRRVLLRRLWAAGAGDAVTVTRIDPPAHSTVDLFTTVKQIRGRQGAIPVTAPSRAPILHQHQAADDSRPRHAGGHGT